MRVVVVPESKMVERAVPRRQDMASGNSVMDAQERSPRKAAAAASEPAKAEM
jgi:hypothetical protein